MMWMKLKIAVLCCDRRADVPLSRTSPFAVVTGGPAVPLRILSEPFFSAWGMEELL